MHIANLLNELKNQEAADLRFQNFLESIDEGRGMEDANVATCQQCDRATVLIEHEHTPQLTFRLSDDEPERGGTYFTCEWCNSEIEPRETNRRMPRKPAASEGGEDETEWARRTA